MTTAAQDLDREARDAAGIAVEESAHAVFAVMLGARIVECFARLDHGEVRIAEPHSRADQIAYAGIFAREMFSYGKVPPLPRLREAFRQASAEDVEHFGPAPELPRHIERDVEYAMPKIRELALILFERGSASHEDIEQVLGITEQRPLPMFVSLFRSRCTW